MYTLNEVLIRFETWPGCMNMFRISQWGKSLVKPMQCGPGLLNIRCAHYLLDILPLFVAVVICAPCAAQVYGDQAAGHSQGNIQLMVSPGGWGMVGYEDGLPVPFYDPVTNDTMYGCVYPRGSGNIFSWGMLVAGGVAGPDTLFSWGFFRADTALHASIWRRLSFDRTSPFYSPDARSNLDLECEFHDTLEFDDPYPGGIWDMGHHMPLGIVGRQRSMAWSSRLIDDFVILDFEFVNIGGRALKQFYAGVWFANNRALSFYVPGDDDLTGFLGDYAFDDGCGDRDTLNLAYHMDDDGDPVDGRFTPLSRRGAVGTMLLGSSADHVNIGYTWFVLGPGLQWDWGPRRRPTDEEPYRSFNPFFAWPGNDRNLYYLMSHPRIAYDQMFSAVSQYDWMQPHHYGEAIASGWLSWVVLSFGPFDLPAKDKISFTIAVVGGDNVHNDPYANFDPYHPQEYYDQLDFSELAENARWAQWVYDNPGVDTDSDGYYGEFRICEGDTVWYKGDGVPDFRGNSPPPAPFTRFMTEPGKIIVRWNGFFSETTKDIFSGLIDFEGYRVYCGLDNRRSSLSLVSTYDRENWFRLKYHQLGVGEGRWINDDPPYSLDSLRIIHNDTDLDPARYTRDRPLFEGDSAFYFQPVDANVADLSSMTGIHKAYPDATDPGIDSTLWTEDDITLEHGRRLPKYYEYEYIIDKLLPTAAYWVSVTVFVDFGYAGGRGNMPPDESNPLNNCAEVYAQTSSEIVEQQELDAYVYPNPYRADAGYHERGYENRKGTIIPDRARLIHFGNLPRVCKIKIFSLDGDLIGTIDHSYPDGGPDSMHDWWNLVSRSGLAVESGLYYWVVESPTRTQIGKLVILK